MLEIKKNIEMKKILLTLMALAMTSMALQAKTLIVVYSFTNNCRTIANDLKSQLADADMVEVQPAEEGVNYAADGYKIGEELIENIRNHPNDASSYPAIKSLAVDFSQYSDIVITTPLWWSNMAAPMQTFLFQNGSKMAGKKIGLIVSSASSGISGVASDAKRLVPQGNFTENLWILSKDVSNCHSMIASWISSTGIGTTTGISAVEAKSHASVFVKDNCLVVNRDFTSVDIYDATGRKLMFSTQKTTDIKGLRADKLYVAVVRDGQGSDSYKFTMK